MARTRKGPLTAKRRNRLSSKSFALPKERAYPIDTLNRARNALSRAAQNETPARRRTIQNAVARKWKSIEVTKTPRRK